MAKKHIIANWKMNLTSSEITLFLNEFALLCAEHKLDFKQLTNQIMVGISPTFVYLNLSELQLSAEELGFWIGGQDVSAYSQGAYTGEINASMLVDSECKYVLIGHSERRMYHQENGLLLNQKIEQALNNHLQPVFCIGETQEQYEKNQTEAILDQQLKDINADLLKQTWIAYEPVWAIGTGKTAQSDDILKTHELIYQRIQVPLLYGGSVNADNAKTILNLNHVDGVLVGGASLKANSFMQIILAGLN